MRYLFFFSIFFSFLFSSDSDYYIPSDWNHECTKFRYSDDRYSSRSGCINVDSYPEIRSFPRSYSYIYIRPDGSDYPCPDNSVHGELWVRSWSCTAESEIPCSSDEVYLRDSGICVPAYPPSCPDDQVLYNDVCQDCPVNAHPSDDQTYCICNDGYSLIGNECVPDPQCDPSTEYFDLLTKRCLKHDCPPPLIPDFDYYLTGRCYDPNLNQDDNNTPPIVDNNDSNDNNGNDGNDDNDGGNGTCSNCDHPSTFMGAPFVGFRSHWDCIDSGGWTISCSGCDYSACYIQQIDNNNTNDINNNTDGTNNDTNSTAGIDSNTSNPNNDIDLSGIENRLDSVINELSTSGSINRSLTNIIDSVRSGSQSIKDEISNQGQLNRSTLRGINDNLGRKLDALKESIDGSKNESNDLLREIRDRLNEDGEDKKADMEGKAGELSTLIDTAIASYTTNFNEISSLIRGLTPPLLSSSGSCSLTVTVLGKTLDIGKGFRDSLPVLRPVVMFIFNLFFLVILVRLSFFAYRDVVVRIIHLFNFT